MRRVRQSSREHPAPAALRLAGAIAVSIGIHAALLALPGVRPASPPRPQASVLHATLSPVPRVSPVKPVAPNEFPWSAAAGNAPLPPLEEARAKLPDELPEDVVHADAPGLPAMSDPVHYEAKDLDTYPRLRDPLAPAYPTEALAQRIAGAVTVLVLIDETGRVTESSVVDATPAGTFDETARDALARASFLPASKDGRIVRSRILVSVAFDPDRP